MRPMQTRTVPYRHVRCVFLGVASVCLFLVPLSAQAAPPSAEEALGLYRSGLAWQERFTLHVQNVMGWEDAIRNPGQRQENISNELTIKKDGARWRWFPKHYRPVEQGNPQGEWEWTGRQEDHLVTTLEDASYYFYSIRDTRPETTVFCYLQNTMKQARVQIAFDGGEGVFAWFSTVGYLPLTDLLPVDGTQVAEETRNGTPCLALSSKTKYARTKAWLDPARGYALVGCTVEVEPEKHLNPMAPPGKEYEKSITHYKDKDGLVIEVLRLELTRVGLQEIDGQYVPIATELVNTLQLEDGREITRTSAYKVTDIDLNPSFEPDAFEPAFGEGQELLCIGPAQQLLAGFEWKNGRVVPRIGENVLNRVKDVVASVKAAAPSGANDPAAARALPITDTRTRPTRPYESSPVRYAYSVAAIVLGLILLIATRYLSRRKGASS